MAPLKEENIRDIERSDQPLENRAGSLKLIRIFLPQEIMQLLDPAQTH
jgi:hypothetical protein